MACLNQNTELDSAAAMRLKALKINQVLGSDAGMADNYGQLGQIYLHQGELREAEKMFRHALAIEQSRGRAVRVAGYYLRLGQICLKRKTVVQAGELLSKGLAQYTQLDDRQGQVHCLLYLGLACQHNGDLNQAETRFKAALEILNDDLDSSATKAAVYSYLGALYLDCTEGAAAEKVLAKALSLYQDLDDARGMGLVHSHLGLAAMLQNCPAVARTHLITAIQTNRRLGLQTRLADNLANLGCLYWSQGKPRSAGVMYHRALILFRSAGHEAKYEQTRALLDGLSAVCPLAENALPTV